MPAIGCEAVVKPATALCLTLRRHRFYCRYPADRGAGCASTVDGGTSLIPALKKCLARADPFWRQPAPAEQVLYSGASLDAQQNRQSLRFLYAACHASISFLYTPHDDNSSTRQSPYDGEFFMSVLDGVSLLLAAGLFVYLLVALLRAGRVEE